jgi:DNA polymerase-3 subunit delta'
MKLIGNEQIKAILRRMLERDRVPRSLLFAGLEGVGKKLFALSLAKSFVCQNLQDFEPCDNCQACRRAEIFAFPKPDAKKEEFERVFFSEHIDIGMVIPCRNNVLVDAIRDLEKEANFRPYEAKARFLIVDDADKMNAHASNALLKTLEEPALTSHIFLISSRPDAFLQTIRSRCQTLRFAPIPANEIENFLLSTKKFSPNDTELVARLSTGSIGRAMKFDLEKFRVQREAMLKILQSFGTKPNYLTMLKTGEMMSDAKNKDDYENYLDILQTLIHDLWTIKLGTDEKNLTNIDLKSQLQKFAEHSDEKRLARQLSEIEEMREKLSFNLNKKIASDALFMQMASH